ncbi:primosomal protein N' [Methylocapsa sp. S129]|uniref:primosomal protein N' n=1 Tax=Methylocapsa sp. S129 TaxID=1641869 RepID=UPI00131C71A8|nr:primosomal protein N' [Methylocapsa sp. S129]
MIGDYNHGATAPNGVADILAPVAVDIAYSYRIPAGAPLQPGQFVEIPLGRSHATGVVWALREGAGGDNLKSIAKLRDWAPLRKPLRDLIDWVSRWTLAPRGMVLRMATRAPEAAGPPAARFGVRKTGKAPERLTPARQRVLAALGDDTPLAKSALAEAAGCGTGVIDGLVDDGALEVVALAPEPIAEIPDPDFAPTALEPDQAHAAQVLVEAVEKGAFSATLLEGVTGSGKTEVYFEAVAAALRAGRQALILLPEIALTAQFLDRFAMRFGARPAEWHSGVPARRRERLWGAVASGEARVVAGARSALFLPFAALGLIIVDEEHEGAYKQEEGVAYNARDMAVVRARLEGAPVVLASATPSIETRVNAEQGRYRWLKLASRFGQRKLPLLAAIDLRREGPPRGRWLSPRLIAGIEEGLGRGEQSLLFLNRRGYAPLTLCRACGHRFQCPNCAAWLVEHRFRRALLCHHCGHVEKRPDICPTCQEADSLTACGPGVERLAEEAQTLFPQARLLVLSSDVPGGLEHLRHQLEEAARGAYDIIIGTQLVAKGHNFPLLTLVGIVDADVGLANGDPRAAERTFQLLQQATGRAGRGEKSGRGLIQTWQPEHPVIAALLSGDVERFYAQETQERRRGDLPPFGRLAAIVVSGADRGGAEAYARALARTAFSLSATDRWRLAPAGGELQEGEMLLLGPAEAPIAMLRGRCRFRLLVKAPRASDLQGFLRALLAAAPPPRGGVRVAVDVDPQSFM